MLPLTHSPSHLFPTPLISFSTYSLVTYLLTHSLTHSLTCRLSNNSTSPITRSHLTVENLIPNRSLRKAIEDEQALLDKSTAELSEVKCQESAPNSPSLPCDTTAYAVEQQQQQPTVTIVGCEGRVPYTMDLLVSVVPPADVIGSRSGCDICCVGKQV